MFEKVEDVGFDGRSEPVLSLAPELIVTRAKVNRP